MTASFDDRPLQSTEELSGIRRLDSLAQTGRRLRIAFVCDTFQDGVPSGGVVAARSLVARLRERHDVVVVGADVQGPDAVRLPGFQFPIRAMREQRFVMARPRRDILARVFANVDVVHLQFPFWLSMVALDEAKRAGRPVVAAFHVQPENALLNIGVRWAWLNHAVYRYWVNRLYNRADVVLCPSEFAERKLRSHGLRANAVIVSNGVPPDAQDAPLVHRRAGRGEFVVMVVGRLAAEKRQDLLIEAVRRSRHKQRIRLIIAGMGPQEDALRRRGSSLPNAAEVGYLPRAQLLSELANADLFVHCGEVELEGIAVLEAMSLGVPVLVADSPESAASQLALDERFRFPAGDVEALTRKLDSLLDHPDLLPHAGRVGQQYARTLDFGESVDKVVGIYQRVCGPSVDPWRVPAIAAG
ncbi:MAG: glycosyltransferase [Deltaproteobacteria bacterium]|nr:glycosyltransferase [Deltaproteobacteria bacterium]